MTELDSDHSESWSRLAGQYYLSAEAAVPFWNFINYKGKYADITTHMLDEDDQVQKLVQQGTIQDLGFLTNFYSNFYKNANSGSSNSVYFLFPKDIIPSDSISEYHKQGLEDLSAKASAYLHAFLKKVEGFKNDADFKKQFPKVDDRIDFYTNVANSCSLVSKVFGYAPLIKTPITEFNQCAGDFYTHIAKAYVDETVLLKTKEKKQPLLQKAKDAYNSALTYYQAANKRYTFIQNIKDLIKNPLRAKENEEEQQEEQKGLQEAQTASGSSGIKDVANILAQVNKMHNGYDKDMRIKKAPEYWKKAIQLCLTYAAKETDIRNKIAYYQWAGDIGRNFVYKIYPYPYQTPKIITGAMKTYGGYYDEAAKEASVLAAALSGKDRANALGLIGDLFYAKGAMLSQAHYTSDTNEAYMNAHVWYMLAAKIDADWSPLVKRTDRNNRDTIFVHAPVPRFSQGNF